MAEPLFTEDRFLGGKLILRQPVRGHRAGHDAMLLAASVAARPGDHIVDLGAGVGAAGLAVACRVPGVGLDLVEIDAALAALASGNAAANGVVARVIAADVADLAALAVAGVAAGSADGVLMNPPFHDDARHPASPDAGRRAAHIATSDTLRVWLAAAHNLLKPQGMLTMIWRADGLADVVTALSAAFGSIAMQPVYAAPGKPAVRLLARATKSGRAPLILYPPVWLDGSDLEAEAAMRGEGGLPLSRRR